MRRVTIALTTLGLALTGVARAQTPPQSPSTQQRFDAAKAKLEARDATGALAQFSALEADLSAAKSPKKASLALVRIYKAMALERLARAEDAKASLRLALAGDALSAASVIPDRDNARLMLARLLESELDYAGAASEYERVSSSTEAALKVWALAGMARTQMFFDAPAAVAHMDTVIALAPAASANEKKFLASAHSIRGRALLNANRVRDARQAFGKAIALRGGLDLKVDGSEVAMRSDAAIAALRAGDTEGARKLLAYTGAGRTETALSTPREMPLPQCGGLEGLRPDDMAVVQFAIRDDGVVAGAAPVFASRQGDAAVAFARSVAAWSWTPESVAKVPAFHRLTTRVEIRCTNTVSRPSISDGLRDELSQWFAGKGVMLATSETGSAAAEAQRLRGELAAPGIPPLRAAALRGALAANASVGAAEGAEHARAALQAIREAGAPPGAWLSLALLHAAQEASSGDWSSYNRIQLRRVEPLLGEAAIIAEPVARASLKLALAELYGRNRQSERERTLVREVANDAALSDKHPLKIAALLMTANSAAAARDLAAAEAAYRQTGLSARQCAALDAPPRLLNNGASSSDFPMEAMRWGFEGWSAQEFDIDARGRTQNVRVVAAYPPAVFAEAGLGIARDARYQASFRPEGGLGCGGVTQRIAFRLPD